MRGPLFILLILLLLACVPGGAAEPIPPSVKTVNEVRTGTDSPRAQVQIPVATLSDLDAVRNDLTGSYVLVADIDASPTAALDYNGGLGWQPIGTDAAPFTGTFDGDGYTITGLTIRRPTDCQALGLFGATGVGSILREVRIIQVGLEGCSRLGGVVGEQQGGMIFDCHLTGTLKGRQWIGGVVGYSQGVVLLCTSEVSIEGNAYDSGGLVGAIGSEGTIENCSSEGSIYGGMYVGGLAGTSLGEVTACGANVDVKGRDYVGGMIGVNHGVIRESYSLGSVRSYFEIAGGLAGSNPGTISASYATGNVVGGGSDYPPIFLPCTGGLVGSQIGGRTENCYARGDASSASYYVGGLIGLHSDADTTNSFSTGHVSSGFPPLGGLIGRSSSFWGLSTISSSYWNIETSGQATSAGGEGAMGRTTDEMTFPFAANTYIGWDFATVWDSGDANNGYPFHRWQTTRYTLQYTAGAHGVLTGPTTQSRIPGATGAPVTAIGLSGYRFDRWSDGSRQNPRADRNITDDLAVQAEFVETTDAWQLY